MQIADSIAIIGVVLSNISAVIYLHFRTEYKLEEMRKETNLILKSIADEMKDFHGRLCAIEEKNKGK